MLTRGQIDLPLTLCGAVIRGDDLILEQLLKRGLDPNESDSTNHTALHIAASRGNFNAARLLLEYGANPNSIDHRGSVPLWEAILGKHEATIKLLLSNGAKLSSSDMGQFVCIAAEQNNLELLQNIVHYGGDVTVPRSDGTTALHFAVSEGNINMVKFLVDQGADIDKLNSIGWSSRNLADQQGHEEIIAFFQSKRGQNDNVDTRTSRNISPSVHFGRYRSEPTMHHVAHEVWHTTRTKNNGGNVHQRKTISNYDNSLFGIMSAARVNVGSDGLFSTAPPLSTRSIGDQNPIRVTICCPEKEDRCGKLVLLPGSITELLEIGAKKFEFLPTKVLSQDRAEINELGVIRDGDRLFLVSDDWNREVHS